MPPSRLFVNHRTRPLPADVVPGPEVRAFHRRLPGYAATPVHDLPALAAGLGLGRVLAKDESSRMGLPAYKILGASWAAYGAIVDRLGVGEEPVWGSTEELAAVVAGLGPLRLAAATDGNHGRAVARMARLLGLDATILVPEGTADARIGAIESEGANVVVIEGTYDDAVAASAALADDRTLVVSDTSWPGYTEAPRRVIEGYATIFAELDEQLDGGLGAIDVIVVPVGVGALAAAVAASTKAGVAPGDGPLLIAVEPESAACVMAAVEAGHVVEVPGPHRSIMAGLNCGLASPLALPTVVAAYDAFVAIDDARCADAVRSLAAAGLDVGESGAASLAGLTAVLEEHRDALPIPETATALVLCTEGVTDPVNFERIVGRPPPHRAPG